jgi:hypothetical protein
MYLFLAQSDSGSVFALFLLLIIVVAIIGASSKKKPKQLRPNECPNCHKDSLETHQKTFGGGSYRKCKHWFLCKYDERTIAAEQEEAAQKQARRARDRQLDERQARFDRNRAELNLMAYDQQQTARRQAESNGR